MWKMLYVTTQFKPLLTSFIILKHYMLYYQLKLAGFFFFNLIVIIKNVIKTSIGHLRLS